MLLRLSLNAAKHIEDATIKRQMAQAVTSYLANNGKVTRCPPARARGTEPPSEGLELLEQPRPRFHRTSGRS